jgi:UDP-N-acetylmuramate--alanine ligase
MFDTLMDHTKNLIIVNADDHNLSSLSSTRMKDAVTFSLANHARYMPRDIVYRPLDTDFSLDGQRFTLSLPGQYNLSNAIACVAILSETGITLKEIAEVLHEFNGIERRFDIHLDDGIHLVVDDYAHNPHKISALMHAAQPLRERICYIFQPHGFGPTRMMKDEYIAAFSEGLRDSDHLILLPIFYAGGTASKDISSHDLARGIKRNGRSVEVVKDRNEVIRGLERSDNYIVMGARDETLSGLAQSIALLLGME